MAAKYDWGDGLGKVHSISLAQHKADVAAAHPKTKGKGSAPAGQQIVPPGTYDPNLDATLGQTTRGLQNLVGLAPNADAGDYGGSTGTSIDRANRDLIRQSGYYDTDLQTATGREKQVDQRSLDDLLKTRTRGTADYGTNLASLQRSYDILGANQNAGIRKAGVASGGAIQQSLDKRTANQALDKAPIDLAYQRAQEDSATAQTRLGEDQTYNLQGLKTTHDRGVGELGISTGRSIDDAKLAASQAINEAGATGQDIQNAKLAQFQQLYPGAKLPTIGVKTTTAPKKKKPRTVTHTTTVVTP